MPPSLSGRRGLPGPGAWPWARRPSVARSGGIPRHEIVTGRPHAPAAAQPTTTGSAASPLR